MRRPNAEPGSSGPNGVTRRGVLRLAAGAAFLVGFYIPIEARSKVETIDPAPNAFIKINPNGDVVFIVPQVEMGQGIYSSLAMVLAEELDAAWSRVSVQHAPENKELYANGILHEQITGASTSVRAFWLPLRTAGARARACIVEAAAQRLKVSTTTLRTDRGTVFHDASGRSLPYGDLVESASLIVLSREPIPKVPKDFRLIGKPLQRLDTPDKTNGRAKFGIDVMPAGVKFATLRICPVIGGKVVHVDSSKAKAVAGVRQVVTLDDVVAVVADHMWAAKCGLEALDIQWNDGPNGDVDTDLIWKRLRTASQRDGAVARDDGDAHHALLGAAVVTAAYEMPFLAHAPMEPLNCTVHMQADQAEVWIGTQVMARVRDIVAKVAGLPREKVTVNNHFIGGSFGRRLEPDMAGYAARIGLHVSGPVKVVWTREEDIRQCYFRPAYHDVISATIGSNRIIGWKHKVTGSAVLARFAPTEYVRGVDPDGVDGARDMAYDIPNLRVEFVREEPPGVNTTWWRGVGANNNVFAIESFMEELARLQHVDSIQFRRLHLDKTPRLRAALDLVEKKSGWGKALPANCGRGVAVQTAFASFIATVVECEVDDLGEVKLRRVTTCVDTGLVINPDTVIAQMQGGIVFGLSAGLWGEITHKKGRVQQSNFHDYRLLRMDQMPSIDVHLIPSEEPPGGIGETGTTASVAALRNAIYDATGVALRRMPADARLLAKAVRP